MVATWWSCVRAQNHFATSILFFFSSLFEGEEEEFILALGHCCQLRELCLLPVSHMPEARVSGSRVCVCACPLLSLQAAVSFPTCGAFRFFTFCACLWWTHGEGSPRGIPCGSRRVGGCKKEKAFETRAAVGHADRTRSSAAGSSKRTVGT